MPRSPSPVSTSDIVHRELSFLFARCQTLGISREDVRACLVEAAADWGRLHEAGTAQERALLRTARAAQAEGRKHTWERASEDWLALRCGAQPGDVVQVSGWVTPREILLDRFVLDWAEDVESPLAHARMVFEGPSTYFQHGQQLARHQCDMHSRVVRSGASKLLRQLFPQRFEGAPQR